MSGIVLLPSWLHPASNHSALPLLRAGAQVLSAADTLVRASILARMAGVGIFVEHSIFGWLLMGLLAGWLSGELVRGKGFGCVGNILLGLIGAVVGGWLFQQLHIAAYGFIGGLAAATLGAVLVVALARAIAGSS